MINHSTKISNLQKRVRKHWIAFLKASKSFKKQYRDDYNQFVDTDISDIQKI